MLTEAKNSSDTVNTLFSVNLQFFVLLCIAAVFVVEEGRNTKANRI